MNQRPVALVTGAARRIGATLARTLHAAGYDLALHCRRSRTELDALIAELERERADSTLALQAELGDLERLPALVDAVVERFGRLDGLVNNASTFFPTPLGTITAQHWDELFAANARAPVFLAQAAAPHLTASRGAIVNLIDIYAERPLAQHSVYAMAKAALATATRALALELAPAVRVNGIAPGAILWPEAGKPPAEQQALIARTPLQRVGSPEDVATTALWLLRDAKFVTGEIVRVDGGRSLLGP
ncbi:pteridine reductase [Dokdonella sp.]|uniref:pteridine reductase n=1 Tax=Dokdonella sp. TaxID=2291710 RepID=UPI001B1F9AF2|nr:pteridine reductase [Dokdonella sp.]MBO9661937.1 pteridine reductase [Dokdonella sp.]